MSGTGRISLTIDSPLRDMLVAARSVPAEVRKQINVQTKRVAEPIWTDELRGRAATRLQQRALVNPARVGVTNRNVFLRSGSVGKLTSGTPVSDVSIVAEFGAGTDHTQSVRAHPRRGGTVRAHTRRIGRRVPPKRRGGYVVYPAAKDSIPRLTSLWIQTATKTALDKLELKS